jgi:ABC-type multidrug transport system ATPase subunit
VLAGRSEWGTPSGLVRINGSPRDPQAWPWLVSYVEETSLFDDKLTARELIQFNTRTRLSSKHFTRTQKDHKAEGILKSLGLIDIADKPTQLLSDGQKKLLSIGIELAGERRLIFMDEPTTGLDSRSAVNLVKILGELAKQYQLSILMSIHQPREKILQHFDRVLLMSHGNSVYYGSQSELIAHLVNSTGIHLPEHENPGDYSTSMIYAN